MDIAVEGMLKAYIDSFDSFPCDNPQINTEIKQFKQELTHFAQSAPDLTAFMADYDAQGYGKRYLDLFGKIALAQSNKLTVEEIEERQEITPVEFAAQYDAAYQAIKANKYRVKAARAYEKLFELAERSEDMLDFNIACERDNLLFKLAADDTIEQTEFLMEASDSLDKISYPQHVRRIKSWQEAASDADITYSSEIEQEETARNSSRETQRMMIISAIANLATEYVLFKNRLLAATRERSMRDALGGMIHHREAIKLLAENLLPAFGLDMDTVFSDKYYRRLLLNPTNLDETGRIKQCHHPQNIEAMREIVTEEMLSEMSVAELLFRPVNTPLYFALSKRGIEHKYESLAEAMNVPLNYYKSRVE